MIERLDTQGDPQAPLTAERVGEMLDAAAHEIEHSLLYFRDFQARMRDAQEPNRFGVPDVSGRGVQDIIYSHGFVQLRDDEALILELDPPTPRCGAPAPTHARWYEPLDYATRVTSRNHRQVARRRRRTRAHRRRRSRPRHRQLARHRGAARGAHHRPLVPTAGDIPRIAAEVVPLADLASHLPDGHPRVDADDRRAEIAGRAAHVAWRYRT